MMAKPFLRVPRFILLKWLTSWVARLPFMDSHDRESKGLGFIVGCGRSGTTILGSLLESHPQVCYLWEPYHLWMAVDRRMDVTNLYHTEEGRFFIGKSLYTPQAQIRFNRLLRWFCGCTQANKIIEKTPHNIARIGFLEALTQDACYIHIVRDGVDVARSIARVAGTNSYKIAGRPEYNQWWGEEDSKWQQLAREGSKRGYFPDEIDLIRGHAQRGVYEWLVSLGEANHWREKLGNRLYELTYTRLTVEPGKVLQEICDFLDLSCFQDWLDKAVSEVHDERHYEDRTIELPPSMCKQFNTYQRRYGFEGRAVPIDF